MWSEPNSIRSNPNSGNAHCMFVCAQQDCLSMAWAINSRKKEPIDERWHRASHECFCLTCVQHSPLNSHSTVSERPYYLVRKGADPPNWVWLGSSYNESRMVQESTDMRHDQNGLWKKRPVRRLRMREMDRCVAKRVAGMRWAGLCARLFLNLGFFFWFWGQRMGLFQREILRLKYVGTMS